MHFWRDECMNVVQPCALAAFQPMERLGVV